LGELLNLAWASIDFERKRIKAERTKSKRVRFVGINSALVSELAELKLAANSKLAFPLSRRSVRTGFESACRKAKVEDFTFHDLRRTFGTRLLERGINIVTIQKLYGHSSVLVTQNYLHPGDELAQEAVERLVETPQKPENLAQIWHKSQDGAARLHVTRSFSVN
jgi:integrase